MIAHLSQSRFFLSASSYEGFGLSLIEAMAAGCIPIVSPIGAFRDIIVSGRNGFLVNFHDPVAAAREISEIMKNPSLNQIAKEAQKTAETFSWGKTIKGILSVYEGVV